MWLIIIVFISGFVRWVFMMFWHKHKLPLPPKESLSPFNIDNRDKLPDLHFNANTTVHVHGNDGGGLEKTICSITNTIPCRLEEDRCNTRCQNSRQTERMVCVPFKEDVLMQSGTTIKKSEPGWGYCLPYHQAMDLDLFTLPTDRPNPKPCTYKNGCRWIMVNHKNQTYDIDNDNHSQTARTTLRRICIYPHAFAQGDDGDCTLQIACSGSDIGTIVGNFETIEQMRCTCRDGYRVENGNQCIRRNLFHVPEVSETTTLPAEYYIDNKYVNPEYLHLMQEYGRLHERNDTIRLLDPCRIDVISGKFLNKSYLTMATDGTVFCQTPVDDPSIVSVQISDDFLMNNGGRYANGVMRFTGAVDAYITAFDRIPVDVEEGKHKKGALLLTSNEMIPIIGIHVKYSTLLNAFPQFQLPLIDSILDSSYAYGETWAPNDIPTESHSELRINVWSAPPPPKAKHITRIGSIMYGPVMEVKHMLSSPLFCYNCIGQHKIHPTGFYPALYTKQVCVSNYYSHVFDSCSMLNYLPCNPISTVRNVNISNVIQAYKSILTPNPWVNNQIYPYTCMFTGMILTSLNHANMVPFSCMKTRITKEYREYMTTLGGYRSFDNIIPQDGIELWSHGPVHPRKKHDYKVTWEDFIFAVNCIGLETEPEQGTPLHMGLWKLKAMQYNEFKA